MPMKLYEWMVKPTPQKEWIERRGILLWLAFFFIELGAGVFIVSSFFLNSAAMTWGEMPCARNCWKRWTKRLSPRPVN